MDKLSHGEKYSQLKDSYVIFLCLFDPFSENLPVYFFENSCRGDDKITNPAAEQRGMVFS